MLYGLNFSFAEALGADTLPEEAVEWICREDFPGLALLGWLSWALSGTPFSCGWRLETWRIPKVLGIMLLGIVAGGVSRQGPY